MKASLEVNTNQCSKVQLTIKCLPQRSVVKAQHFPISPRCFQNLTSQTSAYLTIPDAAVVAAQTSWFRRCRMQVAVLQHELPGDPIASSCSAHHLLQY